MSAAPHDGRTHQGGGDPSRRRHGPADRPEDADPRQADPGADPYLDEAYRHDPYAHNPYTQGGYPYPQPEQHQQQAPQPQGPYAQPAAPQDPYQQDYQQGYPQQPAPQEYAPPQPEPQSQQPGYRGEQPYPGEPYPGQQPPQPEPHPQQGDYPNQGGYPQQPGYGYPQQAGHPEQQPGYPVGPASDHTGYGPATQYRAGHAPDYQGEYHGSELGVDALLSGAGQVEPGAPVPGQVPAGQAPEGQAPGQDPYDFLYRDAGGSGASPIPETDTGWSGHPGPPAPGSEFLDPHGNDYARDYEETYQLHYAPSFYGGAAGDIAAESTGSIPVIELDGERPAEGTAEGKAKGRAGSLLNSSALMAAGTLISRGTGFVRTMIIAAAIGVSGMGDSYQIAYTLPTMVYILVGGGALNAVFVPQLVRSMKNDDDGGEAYANRLLTLVISGLAGVVFVMVLAAPLLVRLLSAPVMSTPASADVTVSLARYCLPTIFFMGVHVVMGQILNARGRFGPMMWTPVLNNVVVIFTFGMYIWVFGTFRHSQVTPATISPEGVRLLGIGTLLGLVVQALSMIPYLRRSGLRFRPRFDWRGHGLGHAAKLARWTFLFVLANQVGYMVVTQLATSAEKAASRQGFAGTGLAAYSNAQLIWQLPQAVITVSVMSAVLPRISRAASDGDAGAVRDDVSYGLRTSAVAIVPCAFVFLALGPWIGSLIYGLGSSGGGGRSIGYMLSAFALGLIPYSAQYVLLRGFYAYEDTRTPFYNTVWIAAASAVLSALCYLVLPSRWAVTGMAFGYGVAYMIGVLVAVPRLRRLLGDLDGGRIRRTYIRLIGASIVPAIAAFLIAHLVEGAIGGGLFGTLATLVAGLLVQGGLFLLIAKRMRIEELNSLLGMVRSRFGR